MRHLRLRCPACNHDIADQVRIGLVAPWVRNLAGVNRRFTKYLICAMCKGGYSDVYYSEEELGHLYDDYRGVQYFQTRSKWEPSYSQAFNESIDSGVSHLDLRRNQMESLIAQVNPRFHCTAECILDIGGGHGGLIPNWSNLKKKFVLDISGVEAIDGVIPVDSWSQLAGEGPIDLIMACGILEHLNSPGEFLQAIKAEMTKSDLISAESLFYFEVPSGIPNRKFMPGKLFVAAVSSLSPILWRKYDKWSTAHGHGLWPIRIAEHIQFFSEEGLKRLIQKNGFELLKIVDYSAIESLHDSKSIRFSNITGVLAKVKS